MRTPFVIQALCLLFGVAKAVPAVSTVDDTQLLKRAATCNTPSNRACWTTGFNINTDYETKVPRTGIVRRYTFNINEIHNWVGPDGHVKAVAMLVNNQYPAPVITADWGDEIEVTVRNNLICNGTSIHWHGIRMLNNAVNDGANGVTECPIPPGGSKVYRFLAEQYGTSWYHSHFSSQYANGITGSILIRGPASLPYDIDLGVFPIQDYYYGAADDIQRSLIPGGAPPPSDNVMFNGTHVDENGNGRYYRVKLQPGKRHLLRLINPSVDNTFTVSLVDHDMTVIATDFVPVNSYTTPSIFMALGQRYDVTIDASKAPGNYWFNVTFSTAAGACGTVRPGIPKPAAIFQYANAPAALPTKAGTPPPDTFCTDNKNFVPVVQRNTNTNTFAFNSTNDIDVQLAVKLWEGVNRTYWNVHGSDMNITWDEPTLEYIAKGDLNFPQRYNVHTVNNKGQWAYWVIENITPVPHPMHLHGHDFLILGVSPPYENPFLPANPVRRFTPATDLPGLRWNNPTRRDVTMLPGKGWLVVAFRVDNPGAWLFHCHIAWHVSQGLSLQFLERVSEIPSTVRIDQIEPNCGAWTTYYAQSRCRQFDSGLKRSTII